MAKKKIRAKPASRLRSTATATGGRAAGTRRSAPARRARVASNITDGSILGTVPLAAWISANKHNLQPPVSNKQLYRDSQDMILFVSGGPNTRNDYHVNPTEELFYQIKGDIAVRVRPLDGSAPHDVVVREGELFLLPRWIPHRPQRPAGTVGMIVEFPRGFDDQGNPQKDGLQWYCPSCDSLVHDARWVLRKIDEDLKVIMEDFWGGPVERRTCKRCGTVIQRAGAIELKGGKVKRASK
ncbi:MAG: hypothetical protein AMXMBFR58_26840 [Phycisphaerae bacterium]|nr:3-hydroxyanthranilate 3,4-dioxygenase [Phycisphaerales bacterium]